MDPAATRIEAKLVTRETLLASDPDFPPTLREGSKFFWVVAKTGHFTIDGPMPPGATPPTAEVEVILLQASTDPADPRSRANSCGFVSLTGQGPPTPWPAWFDHMPAVDAVKIR